MVTIPKYIYWNKSTLISESSVYGNDKSKMSTLYLHDFRIHWTGVIRSNLLTNKFSGYVYNRKILST